MTMYRETIRQSIAEIVEPLLQTQGFELVELQLQQRKGQWLIRVFADVERRDITRRLPELSRDIGLAFDVEDLIATSYVLGFHRQG